MVKVAKEEAETSFTSAPTDCVPGRAYRFFGRKRTRSYCNLLREKLQFMKCCFLLKSSFNREERKFMPENKVKEGCMRSQGLPRYLKDDQKILYSSLSYIASHALSSYSVKYAFPPSQCFPKWFEIHADSTQGVLSVTPSKPVQTPFKCKIAGRRESTQRC